MKSVISFAELKSCYGITLSRQRLHILQQTKRFPKPFVRPGEPGLYLVDEVEAWLAKWREQLGWVAPPNGGAK
jgi:hypothetical protein